MQLKYFLFISALALAASAPAAVINGRQKAVNANVLSVSELDIRKSDSKLDIDMTLDAKNLKVSSEREMMYTPMLVNGPDTCFLEPFIVAGRARFLEHQRNDKSGDPEVLRAGQIKQPISYSTSTPYRDWMDAAKVMIKTEECGCCQKVLRLKDTTIAEIDMTPKTFMPEMAYVTPKAEAVKMRSINARAYIDFPVNQTTIYPDYRRNPSELAKIRATIDSVRNDKNLSITSIHIKGFASPEGSYTNNANLAKGRTETLANYVRNLYHFPHNTITTSSTPEDWEGLIEYVRSEAGVQNLANQPSILALITDPAYKGKDDERERLLKTRYPEDYAFLLENVYPGLRHSDYAVNFSVRQYTDPKEIIETMRTAPQNLSLQELFAAANSVEPGSEVYNEAFEIAARMYPDDPVANLNAGMAAMQRGDLKLARRYLDKAGNSENAQYARAVLEGMQGDRQESKEMLSRLKNPEAREAAEELQQIIDTSNRSYRLVNDKISL